MIVHYYSKSLAVSKFGLSLVPLNPSTFTRVYIVGKGGILVRSRYRDGPAVAGAATVMHYCIMSHIIVVACRLFHNFCLQSLESAGFLRFCAPTHGYEGR